MRMSQERLLYQLWLSPFSRKVRITLLEKKLDFEMKVEKVWDRRPEFLRLNPAGQVPVLVEPDGTVLSHSQVICEYLNEVYPEVDLIGKSPKEKAEVRRLTAWFDCKFNTEVTENLVGEKLMKRFLRIGQPHGPSIRAGLTNIHYHLDYISFLTERRRWLAGEELSLADIAAASHISTVDYIGDVPWEDHPGAKEWYVRIKSRPSFRPLLEEKIPGTVPAKHYANRDF